ncbi:IucA/IucC family C-terminal-domain containing protein [Gracilibacillus alcaliphilus]|uniref:IucA/IucC family C-terminal-domain containing protein n=1 Tax=Gracilibacillus alcaliphilus TaxID=1401441 RepID=UPI001959A4C5|nr:IucA/IucC family C-terminal-domain containing protein [Gracilibacillus alcaliphilus]MBM7676720.1 ferric iron reductase protein FhuF [Gracilibacillus alcaliphilus]
MINLERFFIQQKQEIENGVELIDIWQESSCQTFLEELKVKWGASHQSIVASMLVKRLAVMMVSSTLYCMTVYQKAPLFALNSLQWTDNNCLVSTGELSYVSVHHACERQARLRKLLHDIIFPLIELLHQITRLKKTILWENVAVRIASIDRKMKQEKLPTHSMSRFREDLTFLCSNHTLIIGGENPLAAYLSLENNESRRKTCCLYHQLDKNKGNDVYCALCPLKK